MKSLLVIPTVFAAIQTWESGPSFDISYDAARSQLKFEAKVPNSQYLAIAFGTGMINTDIVFFPGSSSSDLKDLFATSYSTPSTDSTNNYVDIQKTENNGVFTYTAYRSLDTVDSRD